MVANIINRYIIKQLIKYLEDEVKIFKDIKLKTIKDKNNIYLYVYGVINNVNFSSKLFTFRLKYALKYLINYNNLKDGIITKISRIRIRNDRCLDEIIY